MMRTLVITFTDGTTERHRCERFDIHLDVLHAWYDGPAWDSSRRDQRNWPLVNVREYHWEDDR